jgi:succinyl-CoA synthetase beta subunit
VEIEQVAEEHPEKIIKEPLDPLLGLQPWQARKVAFDLGFKGKQVGQATRAMLAVAKMAISRDASLVEINPLIVTKPDEKNPDGLVLAIDAKVSFDDNALFRQKEVASLEDPTLENQAERHAEEFGLSYVALDGNIGCLVNGAGLAMSTMDIIKLHGGAPANFLDVGGSATEESVTEAFRIILADNKVEGVLVNIFGGIMQCDTIAKAIVNAAQAVGFDIPLVVRLEGTNVELARDILRSAKKDIPSMLGADDLAEAAQAVCSAVTVTQ